MQGNASPPAARALFKKKLGKWSWYFLAVTGLTIEESKLRGSSAISSSPNQEPFSRGADSGPEAQQLYPWEPPTEGQEKDVAQLRALKSDLHMC